MTKRWEMTSLSGYYKEFDERLKQLLGDGWEPYAVADNGGKGPIIHYFRREVSGTENAE